MKKPNTTLVLLFLLSSGILLSLFAGSQSRPEEKTAIVCFITGKAWVLEPGAKELREIDLFDWIKSGATIETGTGAKLIVAFSTGERHELGGKTKATMTQAGFTSVSGSIVRLAPAPVMPQIASISRESKPGSRMSGIRLRGRSAKQEIFNLYPNGSEAVLADEAVLSFSNLGEAARFRVEIEDEPGNNILSLETTSSEVIISPGVLKPGANYYWSVRTLEKDKPASIADAEFTTVEDKNAKARNTFKAQVYQSKSAADLLLLVEMDMKLGLRKEACKTLEAALSLSPNNEKIIKASYLFGCR